MKESERPWIQVFLAGRHEAQMIGAALEGNGIRAVVQESGAAGAYPLTVGSLGEGRVLVHPDDVEAARAVISPPAEPDESERVVPQMPAPSIRWLALVLALVPIAALVYSLWRVLQAG